MEERAVAVGLSIGVQFGCEESWRGRREGDPEERAARSDESGRASGAYIDPASGLKLNGLLSGSLAVARDSDCGMDCGF